MPDIRLTQLSLWSQDQLGQTVSLSPVSGDASFRRYFRAQTQDGRHFIAMDAPPEKENSRPFVEICQHLLNNEIPVPSIHAVSLQQGFMLLEDFGDEQLLSHLHAESVELLYGEALRILSTLQIHVPHTHLPSYDKALLSREMGLFKEWYIGRHLQRQLSQIENQTLQKTEQILIESALAQPQVFVHRDYHSRNLMLIEQADEVALGVIDFQDAVSGPITYDLASLLRDCYIAWPDEDVLKWVYTYYEKLKSANIIRCDASTFIRWFDLMGIQRHMKAVGIFSRLNYRDNKPSYLDDIPRTLDYIINASQRYPELEAFSTLIQCLIENPEKET